MPMVRSFGGSLGSEIKIGLYANSDAGWQIIPKEVIDAYPHARLMTKAEADAYFGSSDISGKTYRSTRYVKVNFNTINTMDVFDITAYPLRNDTYCMVNIDASKSYCGLVLTP